MARKGRIGLLNLIHPATLMSQDPSAWMVFLSSVSAARGKMEYENYSTHHPPFTFFWIGFPITSLLITETGFSMYSGHKTVITLIISKKPLEKNAILRYNVTSLRKG